MTTDIAIRYCDEYLARNISDIDKEFLKKAKEALQQEPCDKCVYSTSEGCQYDDITEAIPPVDPQPKTGYWIEDAGTYYKAIHERGCEPDENTPIFLDDIACSECLAKFSVIDNETERFECCPHCGAKMVELRESEEEA